MTELTFKPESEAGRIGDKQIAVPALTETVAVAAATSKGHSVRSARRRFSATRLATQSDDGFRPFRIY